MGSKDKQTKSRGHLREQIQRLQRQNEEMRRTIGCITRDPSWAQSHAKLVITLIDMRSRLNGQLECIEALLKIIEEKKALNGQI